MTTKKIVILLIVCLCLQGLWSAAEDKIESKILDINNNLSVEEWHKETLRLAHERDNLTINLIRLLRHGKNLNKEKKIRICFLLGEYRATRATMDLLNIITLENKNVPEEDTRFALWRKYPAYEALMKIGVPAIPRILKRLETESDLMAMRLEVSVVYYVYGKELTKILLNKVLSKQTDIKKAKNIKKAISLIKWSPYIRLPNEQIKNLEQ